MKHEQCWLSGENIYMKIGNKVRGTTINKS